MCDLRERVQCLLQSLASGAEQLLRLRILLVAVYVQLITTCREELGRELLGDRLEESRGEVDHCRVGEAELSRRRCWMGR